MGLIIAGQVESPAFQTTTPTGSGHLKNDASGNFEFGQSGSSWTFLESIETLEGDGDDDLTFSGLDGDTDRAYRIVWDDVKTTTLGDYRLHLRPNGVIGSAQCMISQIIPGTTPARIQDNTNLVICGFEQINPTGGFPSVEQEPLYRSGIIDFFAGRPQAPGEDIMGRDMISFDLTTIPLVTFRHVSNPANDVVTDRLIGGRIMGRFTGDTGTNITSLTIASSVSTGIGTGKWSLYKIQLVP